MCFFFQAEDGIRDTSVTGVQTCALPIYWLHNLTNEWLQYFNSVVSGFTGKVAIGLGNSIPEIGRASCRERV